MDTSATPPPMPHIDRRGRAMAIMGILFLVPMGFLSLIFQGLQQIEWGRRSFWVEEQHHYGLIDFNPWGLVFLAISPVLGKLALALPTSGRAYVISVAGAQWLLMLLPSLICGNPA